MCRVRLFCTAKSRSCVRVSLINLYIFMYQWRHPAGHGEPNMTHQSPMLASLCSRWLSRFEVIRGPYRTPSCPCAWACDLSYSRGNTCNAQTPKSTESRSLCVRLRLGVTALSESCIWIQDSAGDGGGSGYSPVSPASPRRRIRAGMWITVSIASSLASPTRRA